MCAFSKMVIKKNGRMSVYACTLVDDDEVLRSGQQSALGTATTRDAEAPSLLHLLCHTEPPAASAEWHA